MNQHNLAFKHSGDTSGDTPLMAALAGDGSSASWSAVSGLGEAAAMVDSPAVGDRDLVGVAANDQATDLDRKAALLRLVYRHMARSADYQLPGVEERLDRITASANQISYPALRAQLKLLFKTLATVKGCRRSRDSNSGRAAAHNPSAAGAEAPREEEGEMPIVLQVKDVTVVPEGQYEAVVRRIEERESKFSDSRHDHYLAVTFELTDGDHTGRMLTKGFSPVLSGKSNLGQLWRRIKGSLPVGQIVDVEELIGERVQLIVTHETGEDGEVRERISEVFAPLAGSASEREPVQAGVPF